MCNYHPSRCLVNFKLTFEAVDFFFSYLFFDFETNRYGKYRRKLLAVFFGGGGGLNSSKITE